jgi:hypothetical protein
MNLVDKRITIDRWTPEEMYEHIRVNVKDYGAMVVVAALYKKLYGEFPKVGLSGAQAEYADSVIPKFPNAIRQSLSDKKSEEKV